MRQLQQNRPPRTHNFGYAMLSFYFALMLMGCTAATSTPTITATPAPPTATAIPPTAAPPTATPLVPGLVMVKHTTSETIGGTFYGQGETAVVLASRGGFGQSEWAEFAQTLADEGFAALTIASPDDEGKAVSIVGYAIDFLRANGFKHIICIGASNGASGCAYRAHAAEMSAIVLVTYHGSARLSDVTYPKLFIAGEDDKDYRPSTERGYNVAAEPKQLVLVAGTGAYGAALLHTEHGDELRDMIVEFLKENSGQ